MIMMGVFADKDYREILHIMSGLSESLIAFTPQNARRLNSRKLAEAAKSYFPDAVDGNTAENALKEAEKRADSDSVIIIFGSLSTISTICDILE